MPYLAKCHEVSHNSNLALTLTMGQALATGEHGDEETAGLSRRWSGASSSVVAPSYRRTMGWSCLSPTYLGLLQSEHKDMLRRYLSDWSSTRHKILCYPSHNALPPGRILTMGQALLSECMGTVAISGVLRQEPWECQVITYRILRRRPEVR